MAKPRFSEIDDTNREDHSRLLPDDKCYYLYEYTSSQNWSFGDTNQLISNLKKKPSLKGTAQYRYKAQAIARCISEIRTALNPTWLAGATLVPTPGSKAAGHPDHDDRLEQICRGLGKDIDVRNLVVQAASTEAAHEVQAGSRVTVEQLLEIYMIEEALAGPAPQYIGVLDDMLTAGTHFRAMKTILGDRFPNVPVIGFFVARRVFPKAEIDASDLNEWF